MFPRIFAALLLISLAACGKVPPLGGPAVVVSGLDGLPAPMREDRVSSPRPYLVGAYDKLRIDVFGVPELQREVQIDASGRLAFPLTGVIEASGKTPDEIGTIIRDRLSGQYVRDPQVTVNLVQTISQMVTVDGQVKKPGLYPVLGRMTLMRAIATASGTDEYAKLDDVVIFRQVNGQQMAGLYNLQGIRRGNYSDPEVYANDVIIVGTSEARRMFKDIIQGSSLITTPLILATRKL